MRGPPSIVTVELRDRQIRRVMINKRHGPTTTRTDGSVAGGAVRAGAARAREADGAVAPASRQGARRRRARRRGDGGVATTLAAEYPARSSGHARRSGAADARAEAPAGLELRRAGAGGVRKPGLSALLSYRRDQGS